MNPILSHLLTNWKTSVQGVLSVTIAMGTYFAAVPSAQISQHTAGSIAVATGAAKVILGLLQSDAKPSVSSSVTIETITPIPSTPTK
jgi:hypothetical protein